MSHTPAPWSTDPAGLITAGPHRLHIAQAATTGMGHAADANARLMAAAPELLEALSWALDQIDPSLDPDHSAAMDAARAAITKATKGA